MCSVISVHALLSLAHHAHGSRCLHAQPASTRTQTHAHAHGTYSLYRSLACMPARSLTSSLSHSLTHSLTLSFTFFLSLFLSRAFARREHWGGESCKTLRIAREEPPQARPMARISKGGAIGDVCVSRPRYRPPHSDHVDRGSWCVCVSMCVGGAREDVVLNLLLPAIGNIWTFGVD